MPILAAILAVGTTACEQGAQIVDGILIVTGSETAEIIEVHLDPGDANILDVDFGGDATVDLAFPRTAFSTLQVHAGGGDDTVVTSTSGGTFTGSIPTKLVGGEGDDTITGENGPELIEGGGGDDLIVGRQGVDTIDAGAGDDVVRWSPGDGSDVVHGGADADQVDFTTSNVSEIMSLTPNAGHVTLLRNVANIVMDLDEIEHIAFSFLGGVDSLQVADLTGTDLTSVDVDMFGSGGVDDLAVDEVRLPPTAVFAGDPVVARAMVGPTTVEVANAGTGDSFHVTGTSTETVAFDGTAGADTVAVVNDSTDVVVNGVTPGVPVRLTTVARVDVDLLGGTDSFTALGNLSSLAVLDVSGGPGEDTMLGGNGADVLAGNSGNDFLDGNQGDDTLAGGDDTDTMQWDPGDGDETVDGGDGTDTLLFNGSNIAEVLSLFKVGSHVNLTRNVAAITMDLARMEAVSIRTLGGTDSLEVSDLSGTGVGSVTVDLSQSISGPDGVADVVALSGTSGDDHFSVASAGAEVVTTGLNPTLRVSDADPALDRLTLQGLAGTDTFTATDPVSGLLLLSLVP